MTPPDSGERCVICSLPATRGLRETDPKYWCNKHGPFYDKPDSGERCTWSGYTDNNLSGQCGLRRGHDGPHEIAKPDSDAREVGALRLRWYQRDDGLWNADCACRGTLAGWEESERRGAERWHWMDAKTHNDGTIIRPKDHGPVPPDPPVSLPLPLAQRILAALERSERIYMQDLAAELRALVTK